MFHEAVVRPFGQSKYVGEGCCGNRGLLTYKLHDSSGVRKYALLAINLFGERSGEESSPPNKCRLTGVMDPMRTMEALVTEDSGHVAESRASDRSSTTYPHRGSAGKPGEKALMSPLS